MSNINLIVAVICLQLILCSCTQAPEATATYRAAVVEFAPRLTGGTPTDRLLENTHQYVNFIEDAANQNAHIIVFPEDGLTGWQDAIKAENVDALSTNVPHPNEQISPCVTPNSNFSQSFVSLSCAAQTHKLYTVVNLIERVFDSKTRKSVYHNTNVVFDKNGGVIARYRKINLFNEGVFERGTESVKFKTDFGVTFGIFTCFDISFKFPALDLLEDPSVTAIAYPVAWFSELPFWQGLATQHGYAKSNAITLLAAGLNGPDDKNGGSGIYLPDGSVAEIYLSGIRGSKMIIQDIPIITSRTINANPLCQSGLSQDYQKTNVTDFRTSPEDMGNYTFKALNFEHTKVKETICSGSLFCCTFEIDVRKVPNVPQNYIYKLTAFHGARATFANESVGIRNCGLIACLNDSNESCGLQKPEAPTGIIFEKISVSTGSPVQNAHDQPVTVKHDLRPVFESTYCTHTSNNMVQVNLTTTSAQDSLLVFGIHGRVFSNDNAPSGPITGASGRLRVNIFFVLVLSVAVFILCD